ncbi:Uncharacterised protein [Segatella copri]|nr:Uncharacterised protein [Segatella copri]
MLKHNIQLMRMAGTYRLVFIIVCLLLKTRQSNLIRQLFNIGSKAAYLLILGLNLRIQEFTKVM